MSSIARSLSVTTGRYARATLQRSQNVCSASSRWAITATSLSSTDRMMSLLSSASTGGHHPDSISSRWFSAASSVPTYRSMSDSAKSGDSFGKICFIGAGAMAQVRKTSLVVASPLLSISHTLVISPFIYFLLAHT